jgi:hypothetical protein
MTCRKHHAVVVLLIAFVAGGIAAPSTPKPPHRPTAVFRDGRQRAEHPAAPRISVTVRNRATNDEEQDVTGQQRSFSVTNLTPGIYDVVINESGFIAFRQEVNVTAGKNEPLNIKPQFTIQDFAPVTIGGVCGLALAAISEDQDGGYPFVPNRGLIPRPEQGQTTCRSSGTTSS